MSSTRFRRRVVWGLVLAFVVALPLSSWPLRHTSLLLGALRYRAAPTVVRVPVEGLDAHSLQSTWHAPRSGGRRHEGADLFAKRGTPVVAATHGQVWRIGEDSLGGHVVWVLGEGHRLYYYAHLDAFTEGLTVGEHLRRGDPIGLVGNTGNARTTPPHLHFGVYRIGWAGLTAIDPVPLLKRAPARRGSFENPRRDGEAVQAAAWPTRRSPCPSTCCSTTSSSWAATCSRRAAPPTDWSS